METITIQYGGAPLVLSKCPYLVAVKPQHGFERASLLAVPAFASARDGGMSLGGFQLLHLGPGLPQTEVLLDAARLDHRVQVASHVYNTSDDGVPFVPTGLLYIEFEASAPESARQEPLNRYPLALLEAWSSEAFLVGVTSASRNPVKVAAELIKHPTVTVAEPVFATPGRLSTFTMPGDDLLKDQWHLINRGIVRNSTQSLKKGADAGVVEAWEIAQSLGKPSVTVAVIDDGFDLDHIDLGGPNKVVAPWDFRRGTSRPLPDDGDWHGTACAGVAVGSANNVGIVGAAPGCRLMPLRWNDFNSLNVKAWFDYATENGADVVSCSWSAQAKNYPLCQIEQDAIAACATQGRGGLGCVVCFAAGNETRDIDDPASASLNGFAVHPDVMAIAACTSVDSHSHDSNFGEKISVCAPSSGAGGWAITTADVTGESLDAFGLPQSRGFSPGDYTDSFAGTSSSCALVAGIAALVLSVQPDLTSREVREILEKTARKIGPKSSYGPDGHSREFGFGCVSAARAVSRLLSQV